MFEPCSAKRRAIARPMPRAPPVMTATLDFNSTEAPDFLRFPWARTTGVSRGRRLAFHRHQVELEGARAFLVEVVAERQALHSFEVAGRDHRPRIHRFEPEIR